MTDPLLPGAVVGILGSGQLGRMLALAARPLGYRVHVYSSEPDSPAGQVADCETVGAYDDVDRVRAFARGVDVVTFEFENISAECASAAAEEVRVRPGGHVLHTTQERIREKTFLSGNGFPVASYALVRTRDELARAAAAVKLPGILKAASFGYDGKGQIRVETAEALAAGWDELGGQPAVFETQVDFQKEISVVAARGENGASEVYPVFENAHVRHILDVTFAPAAIGSELAQKATELARAILERLDVVGVLTVEMFVTRTGELLVNELAPRTHNSGHLTIDACVTSQFEQQLRAVCGLPLGSPELIRPAAMANLLGDLWKEGAPGWAEALKDPGIKLHLYGKAEPKPGRKMGHLSATALRASEAVDKVMAARSRLTNRP